MHFDNGIDLTDFIVTPSRLTNQRTLGGNTKSPEWKANITVALILCEPAYSLKAF